MSVVGCDTSNEQQVNNLREYVAGIVVTKIHIQDETYKRYKAFYEDHACSECGELANYANCFRCGLKQCFNHLNILTIGKNICKSCLVEIGGSDKHADQRSVNIAYLMHIARAGSPASDAESGDGEEADNAE